MTDKRRQWHPPRKEITVVVGQDDCWNCGPELQRKHGYPYIRRLGKQGPLSRWVYQLFKGVLRDDEVVRHTCDNTACINPMHLIKGTSAQNVRDAVERDRVRHGERHPRATLTAEIARAIAGDTTTKTAVLALRYGTTTGTITKIRKGQLWRRATGIVPSSSIRPGNSEPRSPASEKSRGACGKGPEALSPIPR